MTIDDDDVDAKSHKLSPSQAKTKLNTHACKNANRVFLPPMTCTKENAERNRCKNRYLMKVKNARRELFFSGLSVLVSRSPTLKKEAMCGLEKL